MTCVFFSPYFQNTSGGEKSWEVLLGHVVSELSKGKIFEEGETEELTVVLANLLEMYTAYPPFHLSFNSFSLVVIMSFL